MPIARAIERNSLSLPNSPQKHYTLASHLPPQQEEDDSIHEKISSRKNSDSSRKTNGTTQKSITSTLSVPQSSQASRRQTFHEGLPPMRGRSNTDVQSVTPSPSSLKQQQLNIGGSGSDRSINHYNQQQQQQRPQSPDMPPKPKCMLPTTTCQSGYVTPSKLFNMMGYGLENQYLFMLAHYLYIIDCRPKEKFNESHIVTGNFYSLKITFNVLLFFVR
jgi:hypothetical protein